MADFVAALRRLSEHYEFGDGLDDLLRDRLICGCNEDRLQKNLLAKTPPPNFKVAIAMWLKQWSLQTRIRKIYRAVVYQLKCTLSREIPLHHGVRQTVTAVVENIPRMIADSRRQSATFVKRKGTSQEFAVLRQNNRGGERRQLTENHLEKLT